MSMVQVTDEEMMDVEGGGGTAEKFLSEGPLGGVSYAFGYVAGVIKKAIDGSSASSSTYYTESMRYY